MITITEFEGQKINDQFGILPGDRYEFIFYLDIPEDDELFNEAGIYARVLFVVDGDKKEILNYHLAERSEGKVLEFDLEDEELQLLKESCEKYYTEL